MYDEDIYTDEDDENVTWCYGFRITDTGVDEEDDDGRKQTGKEKVSHGSSDLRSGVNNNNKNNSDTRVKEDPVWSNRGDWRREIRENRLRSTNEYAPYYLYDPALKEEPNNNSNNDNM